MTLSGRYTCAVAIAAATMLSGCDGPNDKIIEKATIKCSVDMSDSALGVIERETARIISADEAAKRYEVTMTVVNRRFGWGGICTATVQEGKETRTSYQATGDLPPRKK